MPATDASSPSPVTPSPPSPASAAPPDPPAAQRLPSVEGLLVAIGNYLFHARNYLFPIAFIGLALIVKPVWLMGDERADRWLDAVGIVIALTGELLRYTVIGLAYIKRGGKQGQIFAPNLVTGGLFAHCRNPLYAGNALMILGLIIVHNSPWMYALGLPFFALAYYSITLAEEQYLRNKFGKEYADYCRRVPRYLIKFRGMRATLTGMRYDWRKAINKEHGTTMTWTSALLALLYWERLAYVGFDASRPALTVLLILWGVAWFLYLAVRVLRAKKKS